MATNDPLSSGGRFNDRDRDALGPTLLPTINVGVSYDDELELIKTFLSTFVRTPRSERPIPADDDAQAEEDEDEEEDLDDEMDEMGLGEDQGDRPREKAKYMKMLVSTLSFKVLSWPSLLRFPVETISIAD